NHWRKMGIFIQVKVDATKLDAEKAQACATLCPVDVFALEEGRLTVVEENEDECTLCELCLKAAPSGAITIVKLYKDEALVSRGQ
ncbi:MAG: ferredoxin family protein, partial [Anaerolineae bacterium]